MSTKRDFKTRAKTTFRLGECMTGAGGEGGPRGIFLLILKDKPKHNHRMIYIFPFQSVSQVFPPHFLLRKASNKHKNKSVY